MNATMNSMVRALCISAVLATTVAASEPEWQTPPPPPKAPTPMTVETLKVLGSGTYLGVGVQEVDSERAKALKLKEEYGVEVTRIDEDSPAQKAGLQTGDVVIQYNGQRVEGTEQFVRFVRETPAGRTVKLQVWRAGAPATVAATLGTRKSKLMTMAPMEGFKFEMPERSEWVMPDIPRAMMSWRSPLMGIEGESLGESQLATYFGVKSGVLVRSVIKGSAAEKAGLKAGDVVVKVDEMKVQTLRDVSTAMRTASSSDKKTVAVLISRDRSEMTIPVTVLEDESGDRTTPKAKKMSAQGKL